MLLSEEHIKSGSLHRNISYVSRGAIGPGYSRVHFNTCEGRACGRGRDFSCAYWQSEAMLGEMRWKGEINQSWREERGESTFFAIIFIYLEFYFKSVHTNCGLLSESLVCVSSFPSFTTHGTFSLWKVHLTTSSETCWSKKPGCLFRIIVDVNLDELKYTENQNAYCSPTSKHKHQLHWE